MDLLREGAFSRRLHLVDKLVLLQDVDLLLEVALHGLQILQLLLLLGLRGMVGHEKSRRLLI